MDEKMLNTQCRDFANCINGLSLTLLEAGSGNSGLSRIVSDVHKLIQSFRLLGNHYVCELLKKCRELETKSQEVKDLSFKLEKRAAAQNPAFIPEVDEQRRTGRESQAEELSKGADDPDKLLAPYSEILQTLEISSEELKRSLTDLAHSKRDSGDSREGTGHGSCNKRHLEIIDVGSDSDDLEEVKRGCVLMPLPKKRRLNGRHVVDPPDSTIENENEISETMQDKVETMQDKVDQEQRIEDDQSKLMGDNKSTLLDRPSSYTIPLQTDRLQADHI